MGHAAKVASQQVHHTVVVKDLMEAVQFDTLVKVPA
jgi:hypothetical protein